jgi:cytochrome P450
MPEDIQLSPTAPRPGHVPSGAVYDFDFYADPAMRKNPHDRVLEITRDAPPVFWTPRNGGHWIIRGHSAVFKASRQPELFTVEIVPYSEIQAIKAKLKPGEAVPLVALPNSVDPPVHATFRTPLQGVFSPKSIMAMRDEIRALAVELIETERPRGNCEFMAAIAEPMPVTVFLKMFGLPVERQGEYRALVKEHFSSPAYDAQGSQLRLRKVADIMSETILERRENPGKDIISTLWQAEFFGKEATLSDLENYCVMLFLAGLDTVMNGMGLGVCHLARNPGLQAKLRASPALIADATEEIIRRYTFTLPVRFVTKNQTFEGLTMKKGEMVLMFLPAADLDPGEFPEPDAFDMERANKAHIAFGTGPHRCLGSHLARVELQILYEELLARLPEFRLDPEKPLRYHGGNVWGPDELHLLWDS